LSSCMDFMMLLMVLPTSRAAHGTWEAPGAN
jgi:hypothetical protein